MNARPLPDTPATPERSTDATGVLTGNADLVGVPEWRPWAGPAERPPLPGPEHQLDPEAKAFPWLTEFRALAFVYVAGPVVIGLRLAGVL